MSYLPMNMGSQASINWVKIKNKSKYFRMVKPCKVKYKKSGPLQKWSTSGARCRRIARNKYSLSFAN